MKRFITIYIGRKKDIPEGVKSKNVILVGDCLKKYCDRGIVTGGCPPAEPFPLFAILDRKDYIEDVGTTEEKEKQIARYKAGIKILHGYMLNLIREFRANESSGAKK